MAKKQRGPTRYTGLLAKPIYVPVERPFDVSGGLLAALAAAPDKQSAERRGLEQCEAKLSLLFEHYKIDPQAKDRWRLLCFRLAFAHVPGMQVIYIDEPKPGRRRIWPAGLGDQLVDEVDAIRSATGNGIGEAIVILRKDSTKNWRKHNAESLKTRYREARRRREEERDRPPWPGVWERQSIPGSPGLLELLLNATDEN